jgi:hypothetical protein
MLAGSGALAGTRWTTMKLLSDFQLIILCSNCTRTSAALAMSPIVPDPSAGPMARSSHDTSLQAPGVRGPRSHAACQRLQGPPARCLVHTKMNAII